MYIAIEGLKGSGKSTLFERLPQRLRDYGLEVVLLCPTHPLPCDHPLERLAASAPSDDELRERLYAARSNHHAAQVPSGAQLVLGDRSILTSYATRWHRVCAGQRRLHIERVNRLENRIGLPDHVLFLNVPAEKLLCRLQARIERSYGRHDETPQRLQAALAAYAEMRERRVELGLGAITWHDIDADVRPNRLLARVVVRILEILRVTRLIQTSTVKNMIASGS